MIYKTKEAAEWLGVDRHMLGCLRHYGLIHAVKIGKGYGYRPQELERFIEWAEDKNLGTRDHIKYWSKQLYKKEPGSANPAAHERTGS